MVQFINILLDCAVEMSHKTPVYAALIGEDFGPCASSRPNMIFKPAAQYIQRHAGLINTGENAFVDQLISTAQTEFEGALAVADRNKARLLLRLFAALVPSNALHASSVLNALHSIVEAAIEVADTGMVPGVASPGTAAQVWKL